MARAWFAATALAVAVGLAVQLAVTWNADPGYFDTAPARVANVFCFFTVQSNVLVCVTTALLALGVAHRGTVFAVFRLIGLVGITITFVVFHVALSGLQDLEGSAALADFLLHTVSPILCVLGWLLFGPRRLVTPRAALWSFAFPVLWLSFTLIRGTATDYYPYPFLDVAEKGWGTVALNGCLVAALFGVVTFAAWFLDRRLPAKAVSGLPVDEEKAPSV